jgi:heavy metal sensor kinase
MMKRTSVRLQLTLWNVGILAIALLGLGLALRFIEQETLVHSIDRTLIKFGDAFQQVVDTEPEFPYGGDHRGSPPDDHHGPSPGDHRGGPPDDRRDQSPGDRHDPQRPQDDKPGSPPRPQDDKSGGPQHPQDDKPGGPQHPQGDNRPGGPRGGWRRLIRLFGSLNDYTPTVLDLQGNPLWRGAQPGSPWDARAFHASLSGQTVYTFARVEGAPCRIMSMPLKRSGAVIAVVQVRRSMSDVQEQLRNLERVLWILAPFALIVAGLGGAFLTNRALSPVRNIARAAERVEASSLSERLPVVGGGEFAQLSITFNAMLERLHVAFQQLEESNEQQRRFVADASHELRTPLSIIKANTSLALMSERTPAEYRKALVAADDAVDRTGRIVQDLLLLARADDNQLEYPLEPTRIEDVLHRAAQGIHGDAVAPVSFVLPDPAVKVCGNPEALTRLFTNLLDNASRHTPPDGKITVTARREHGSVVITVADTGEGIAPEHLPHIAERFYRVDTARSRARGGTGLGLAICQTIVRAHDGAMRIDSILGKGTTVTITLPGA